MAARPVTHVNKRLTQILQEGKKDAFMLCSIQLMLPEGANEAVRPPGEKMKCEVSKTAAGF